MQSRHIYIDIPQKKRSSESEDERESESDDDSSPNSTLQMLHRSLNKRQNVIE